MKMKLSWSLAFIFASSLLFAQKDPQIVVPMGGNAYTSGNGKTITKAGIVNWENDQTDYKVYVRLTKPGILKVAFDKVTNIKGTCQLSIAVNRKTQKIKLTEGKEAPAEIGSWKIKDTGYIAITIKGLKKTANKFPDISGLVLSGNTITPQTSYVKDDKGNFFYWGRRGPSVHLAYQLPRQIQAEWFYNELTVPEGEDMIGSYFMANGFGEGYFGIQVNSATERTILFSVWSPFETDNPKDIPDSHKIQMVKKGKGVHTGEFGHEGAGGQSYLKYNWKAGNTYKFLLQVTPSSDVKDTTTTYTTYFFAPELNEWQLIASFKRPKIRTYLKSPHSFLENFIPDYGDRSRKVLFNNQWVCDTKGNWTPLNTARFTIDNTGSANYRKDYAGGLDGDSFYLKNCGFFNHFTPAGTKFSRKKTGEKPQIDFSKLP